MNCIAMVIERHERVLTFKGFTMGLYGKSPLYLIPRGNFFIKESLWEPAGLRGKTPRRIGVRTAESCLKFWLPSSFHGSVGAAVL